MLGNFNGLYYMDRNENSHVFIQAEKNKDDYKIIINFKSGSVHIENWSEIELKDMIEKNFIAKVEKMNWESDFIKPKIKIKKAQK